MLYVSCLAENWQIFQMLIGRFVGNLNNVAVLTMKQGRFSLSPFLVSIHRSDLIRGNVVSVPCVSHCVINLNSMP